VLDPDDDTAAASARVLAADLLVVASPTYKATYSGLLKAFLDRLATGGLSRVAAVPILLGGAPNHRLAVDVNFTPRPRHRGAATSASSITNVGSDAER
jgi:FMN reductase